jgi:hypothetical protein
LARPSTDVDRCRQTGSTITPEIFEAHPPRRLVHGKVVLIGDAAHPMRPTFGQGALQLLPDPIFGAMTSSVSRWRQAPEQSMVSMC